MFAYYILMLFFFSQQYISTIIKEHARNEVGHFKFKIRMKYLLINWLQICQNYILF